MGLFDRERGVLSEAVQELRASASDLRAEIAALTKQRDWTKEERQLREQIETLRIEKGRIEEENARKLREVTHQVGLERLRQEAEAEQAKKDVDAARREAVLEVREKNLAAERDAFDKQMEFQRERFEQEQGYLRDLLGQILKRLPDISVAIEQGDRHGS